MPIVQTLDFEITPHHAVSRGNNKATVFHEEEDFRIFLSLLAKAKTKLSFFIYHYILMTNHVHLLLSPGPGGNLGEIMKCINFSYSMVHKAKYGTVGHVWKNRYGRFPVTNDSYMLTCGIYIELNPVRAGMVAAPEDYRWSSYRTYAYGERDPLLTLDPAYLTLGRNDEERQVAYRALVDMWLENDVDKRDVRQFFKKQAGTIHPNLKK